VIIRVDLRDLNKVSPTNDFSLPHIDILVNNTIGHALLSFMDGYVSHNQVNMVEEDMEKTIIISPWGTYCYTVMPFGLKNTKLLTKR